MKQALNNVRFICISADDRSMLSLAARNSNIHKRLSEISRKQRTLEKKQEALQAEEEKLMQESDSIDSLMECHLRNKTKLQQEVSA